MKNLNEFENFDEPIDEEAAAPNVAEALGNLLDGLAGVLGEGRISTDNYWNNLDGDLAVLLDHLKELDPKKHEEVIKYF